MAIVAKRRLWRAPGAEISIDGWQAGPPPGGWIPADISAGNPVVRWINAADGSLAGPFFRDSILDLRSKNPPMRERETSLEALGVGREWALANPTGLILHVSRCGSTLIANALKAVAPSIVVLSEAMPFETALDWIGSPSSYWAGLGAAVIPALTSIYANYQRQGALSVVAKCTPGAVTALRAFRVRFATVPSLIVIRNPIEVLASNMADPPRWLVDWYEMPRPRRLGSPPKAALAEGFAGFCAWVIGRWCSEVLAAIDGPCWILDYADIVPDIAVRIAQLFGLTPGADFSNGLAAVFRSHAKRPTSVFEPDGERKRASADAATLRSIKRWAEEPYRALLGHPQRIRGSGAETWS